MKKWVIGGVLLCSLVAALALVMPDLPPKAQLRVIGTVIRDGVDRYELELTNHTPYDLQYRGFEPGDPSLEYLYWEAGEWKEPQGYHCGFGLAPQTLTAGSSVRFMVVRPVDTPCRWGVFLRPPGHTPAKYHELDWLPASIRTWAQNWQKERLHEQWLKEVTWTPPLEPAPYSPAEKLVMAALEDGVTMDLENLFAEDPHAAGPPAPIDPNTPGPFAPGPAGADPFAPAPGNMASASAPFASKP